MAQQQAFKNFIELHYGGGKQRCIEVSQIRSVVISLEQSKLMIECYNRTDGCYETEYKIKEQYDNLKKLINPQTLLKGF